MVPGLGRTDAVGSENAGTSQEGLWDIVCKEVAGCIS
jgi:hypothetical protein